MPMKSSGDENSLNDRLSYALKMRPATVTISSRPDGKYTAGYMAADDGTGRVKLYVNADDPAKALNSLSRKVHGFFHPREDKED